MSDRARWDAKWAARAEAGGEAPDEFVLDALEILPPGGRAVELAAGTGRHALELARRGFETEAWDVSPVALERLSHRAAEQGLAIETRAIDLSAGTAVDGPPFDLVVIVNFLDRGLLAACERLVRPGGHVIFTTFTVDRPGDHPRADWCLERGELERGLVGFETLQLREAEGRAGILARRVAGESRP